MKLFDPSSVISDSRSGPDDKRRTAPEQSGAELLAFCADSRSLLPHPLSTARARTTPSARNMRHIMPSASTDISDSYIVIPMRVDATTRTFGVAGGRGVVLAFLG
jgi:hypothetical protein